MWERLFRLREQGTNARTEVLGGVTTFMTMAYIVFVNPAVLSGAGMDFGAVMTATCISAAVATLAMGVLANYPIALAPGMGENFFFLSVCVGMGVAWETVLGAVFLAGVMFVLLTFLRIRELIIDAIPASLKHAIAVGIGLFIAFIGLVGAGIVERSDTGMLMRLGDLSRPPVLVACLGLLVTLALMARRIKGAILAGIIIAILVARPLNALALGDEAGRGLGARPARTRVLTAIAITALCGAATAGAGPIVFIGLTVPHMARAIVGPDQRWVLAYSMVLGAALLLAADTIGRVIDRPGEVAAGVVVAVIGAPVFMALVRRRRLAPL